MPEQTTASPPALWRGVPPKHPNFTGRQDLLLALRSKLSQAGITALYADRHVWSGRRGKTQIAIEYVYRFASDYHLICWVSGEIAEPAANRPSRDSAGPEHTLQAAIRI